LATTRNKNEQQQDDKNNADIETKWTKTNWKDSEETIRSDRKKSIERQLVTDDDGDNDDDDDDIEVVRHKGLQH
jgi:hypothetical protein